MEDEDKLDTWKGAHKISFLAGDYVVINGDSKASGGGSNPVCLPEGSGKSALSSFYGTVPIADIKYTLHITLNITVVCGPAADRRQ